jgi:hypothetical protein
MHLIPNADCYHQITSLGEEFNVSMQPTPTRTNGMAIAGFVLSFFCSPLGLIFSAIGLSQTNRDPSQSGRGLAIAGLVISIVSTLFALLFWGALTDALLV